MTRLKKTLFLQTEATAISVQPETTAIEIDAPATNDAAQIWQLVRETVVLDANSAYLYLLLCRDFSGSCLVARQDGRVVGFVTGYRLPQRFQCSVHLANWRGFGFEKTRRRLTASAGIN